MKRAFWLLLVAAFALSSFRYDNVDTAGINFFDGKLGDAKKEAKKENRPLFVFIGSSECDLCHRMKDVFKNAKVVEYYESNFICYKIIDPWKKPLLYNTVTSWGMKTVPTYAYFTPKGKKILLSEGFKDAGEFINQGITVLGGMQKGGGKKK